VAGSDATIFDVQRFSVHDGPGIRTTVFFKGCPLRCRWCQNPESLRAQPEIAFYADRCRDGRDCRAACPRDALRWNGDRVDRGRCDACGRCADACAYEALRVVGRRVSVDDLVEQVLRDVPFYAASGGGVTLSGGEPTLQIEFIGDFAGRCRERGLTIVLQTCGMFRWEAVAPHLPAFTLIQYDLKLIDPREHRRMTGGDNAVILENARRMSMAAAPVQFRMPVLPGVNDDDRNLRAVAEFLRGIDARRIHLLRYHELGQAKLARIDAPFAPLGLGDGKTAAASLARAADVLEREGLEVTR
jgi:pyruvate formate lyase activating enzyme